MSLPCPQGQAQTPSLVLLDHFDLQCWMSVLVFHHLKSCQGLHASVGLYSMGGLCNRGAVQTPAFSQLSGW